MGNDHDRRRSFRCAVDNFRQEGELRAGRIRAAVRVCDQSADGFTVQCHRTLPLKTDDLVQLWLAGARYEARVVYVGVVPADDQIRQGTKKPAFRVGLQRIRDLGYAAEADEGKAPSRWSATSHRLRLRRPATAAQGIVLALLIAVVPIVLLVACYPHRQSLARSVGRWFRQSTAEASSEAQGGWIDRISQTVSAGGSSEGTAKSPADLAGVKSGPRAAGVTGADLSVLGRLARRRSDASVFVMPQVAQYLSLTPAQQRQIQRIVEATGQAMERLGSQLSQATPEQRAGSQKGLLEVARQEALGLLSNQQRERWAAVEGTSASP
jgi:hypothetical protein